MKANKTKSNTDETATIGTRRVVDGERLSGHRVSATASYGEILISDGQGVGRGSLMCSISSFHWCDVMVKGDETQLRFQNATALTISSGIVEYAPSEEEESTVRAVRCEASGYAMMSGTDHVICLDHTASTYAKLMGQRATMTDSGVGVTAGSI